MKLRLSYDRYIKFIRFSLGLYEGKEFLTGGALGDFDWSAFYNFCKKQTLTGVAFDGIMRISEKCNFPQDLLMTWYGQSQKIKKRNAFLNEATLDIYDKIAATGMRCCILKGQGNALMYPNPYARTPGDIDVWVNASRKETRRVICALVKDKNDIGKESLNHIEAKVGGVQLELHSTPAILNNPFHNNRLQRWLRRNADFQCGNLVTIVSEKGMVAIPTLSFNVVYQLLHLYHHYFYEGIGLRQFLDYYFVIINAEGGVGKDIQLTLRRLGLWKFAGAVMYVLHEVFALTEDKKIAPMDEQRGRLLLEEVLRGGNFGQHDESHHHLQGAVGHNILRLQRDFRLLRYYPEEALAEPFFRLWHFVWRRRHV